MAQITEPYRQPASVLKGRQIRLEQRVWQSQTTEIQITTRISLPTSPGDDVSGKGSDIPSDINKDVQKGMGWHGLGSDVPEFESDVESEWEEHAVRAGGDGSQLN
ncbi:hypothetical protein HD806DRAFT_527887 [Xylariaceae sp. AK1471]|nr:hypothetical protein HD806DRAFT_527887 [Xylariaceae sp. AK1471]